MSNSSQKDWGKLEVFIFKAFGIGNYTNRAITALKFSGQIKDQSRINSS